MSSFALERADSYGRRIGLLTCDVLLGNRAFPPEMGQWHTAVDIVAYSCWAVADFHRASRTSRLRVYLFPGKDTATWINQHFASGF